MRLDISNEPKQSPYRLVKFSTNRMAEYFVNSGGVYHTTSGAPGERERLTRNLSQQDKQLIGPPFSRDPKGLGWTSENPCLFKCSLEGVLTSTETEQAKR